MDLIAPVVHAIAPTTLRDLDVLETMRVADGDLPDSFRKLRSYLAALSTAGNGALKMSGIGSSSRPSSIR